MFTDKYITASCVINARGAYRNGKVYLDNREPGAQAFLAALYQHLDAGYSKFHKMDNLSKLGWLATEVLINKEPLLAGYAADDIGVILSNSNSSLDVDIKYYQSARDMASPALFVYTLPNIMIGEICIRQRIKGENAFFISPEFDGAFIEQYVDNLINNNILQACICGWVELVGEEYKAVLFLVEKQPADNDRNMIFNVENINKTYQSEHG